MSVLSLYVVLEGDFRLDAEGDGVVGAQDDVHKFSGPLCHITIGFYLPLTSVSDVNHSLSIQLVEHGFFVPKGDSNVSTPNWFGP